MPLSRQEIFTKAVVGLHSQGYAKSTDDNLGKGSCAYRGHGGLRCAVGHLIDDAHYSDEFEGYTPGDKLSEHERQARQQSLLDTALAAAGVDLVADRQWLTSLQGCHDNADSAADMRNRLCVFATREGLTFPEGC